MANVALTTITPLVRQHVTDCPDFIIEGWLLHAARELCQEARLLRETLVLDSVVDQAVYTLTPTDAMTEIVRIKAAEWNGEPLEPSAPEEIQQQSGYPEVFWYLPPGQIVVGPTPLTAVAEVMLVNVILAPTLAATEVSEILDERTIAEGAMAELFSMPGKAWSNPQHATYHRQRFEDGKLQARTWADTTYRPRRYEVRSHW